jgi:HEAT repeat protein
MALTGPIFQYRGGVCRVCRGRPLPLAAAVALTAFSLLGCDSQPPAPVQYKTIAVPPQASAELQAAIEHLNSPEPLKRAYGAALLAEVPERKDTILPVLLDVLQDGNHLVRSEAAESLGKLGSPEAVDPLIAIIRKPQEDRDVRARAAQALGRLQARQAVEPLVQALDDIVWRVRYQAVVALGRIGDPSARAALAEAARYDPDFGVRQVAQEALQQLPDSGEQQQAESVGRDAG